MKNSKQHIVCLILAMLLLAVGCRVQPAPSEAPTPSTTPQSLTIGLGAEPTTLLPYEANDHASKQLALLLFEGLVRYDEDQIIPAAADYEISNDFLTYTFTLRQGLKWSDGSVVSPSQFREGILRAINPANKCPDAHMYFCIKNASEYYNQSNSVSAEDVGIKADDSRIIFTLTRPTPEFLSILALPSAMPFHSKPTENNTIVSNGAFKITSKDDQGITLTKIENYRNAVAFNKIVCKYTDFTDSVESLTANGLDASIIPTGASFDLVDTDISTTRTIDGTVLYAALNQNGKLKNADLRRAISAAIDREALSAALLAYPATGMIPDSVYSYRRSIRYELPTYSVLSGDSHYIDKVSPISNLKIRILTVDESPFIDAANDLEFQLSETLSAEVTITTAPQDRILTLMEQGEYDMAILEAGQFTTAVEYIDKMTNTASTEDIKEREKEFIDDAVYIPLSYGTVEFGYSSNLSGIIFRHDGLMDLTRAKIIGG